MKKLISLLAVAAFSATSILPAAAAVEPNELVPATTPAAESARPVYQVKKATKAKKVNKTTKAKHKAKKVRKHRK